MLRALGISQATLVKYLAELRGGGLIVQKPFGTAVVYEILYDVAIVRGLANKYEIFDLNRFLIANNQPQNPEWIGKVFNFRDMVYIYAKHKDGFTVGIPVYDNDWKGVVEAVALGLNIQAFINAMVIHFGQR